MAAHKGNKYAEEWTLDKALEFIRSVEEYVNHNEDCYYIGEAVTECGQYREIWNYLTNKFSDSKEVFHTSRGIEERLENRLYKNGLKNRINPRLVEFGLRNNHGWKDRREHDHTTGGQKLEPVQVYLPDNGRDKED